MAGLTDTLFKKSPPSIMAEEETATLPSLNVSLWHSAGFCVVELPAGKRIVAKGCVWVTP